MQKNLFKRAVGPFVHWFYRHARALCGTLRDHFCPPEGEYSIMIKHALNFGLGSQIEGDYLEFGVSKGVTMAAAFRHARKLGLNAIRFYAFDSFEGLPEISGQDAEGPCHYHKGQYACGLEQFKKNLTLSGADLNRLTIVQGWYSDVLNDKTKKNLPLKKAAVVWIDCDLYESTAPALEFITDYVQTGTILCFDDFYCFAGDPDRGESRALKEWLAKHPRIKAIEYRKYEAAGLSFILNVSR